MFNDYAAAFSLLAYFAWSGLAIWANLNTGVGKPLWEVTIREYELWFRTIAACSFLYPIMTTAIRVTILLFYKRLFSPNTGFNWTVRILIGLQCVYLVVFTITPGFVCTPLYASWTLELYGTHCNMPYYGATTMALYSTSLGLDFILTFIALWPISQLKLPTKKKLGIAALFMTGFMQVGPRSRNARVKMLIMLQCNHRNGRETWFLGVRARPSLVWRPHLYVDALYLSWSDLCTANCRLVGLTYQFSMFIASGLRNYAETFWIPSQLEPTVALICASIPALSKAARSFGTRLMMSIVSSKRMTMSLSTMGMSARSGNKGYIKQDSYKNNNLDTEIYGDEVRLNNMSASGRTSQLWDGRP